MTEPSRQPTAPLRSVTRSRVHERMAARIHAIVNCTVQKCAERRLPRARARVCTCTCGRARFILGFLLPPPPRDMQMRFIALGQRP